MTIYLQILVFIGTVVGCLLLGYNWHKVSALKRILKVTEGGKTTIDFGDLLYIVTGKR